MGIWFGVLCKHYNNGPRHCGQLHVDLLQSVALITRTTPLKDTVYPAHSGGSRKAMLSGATNEVPSYIEMHIVQSTKSME
jgi:hypothetical protein